MGLGTKLGALLLGCTGVWVAAQQPGAAASSVSLKPGESAQSADGTLRFGFEGVSADSRCPKNVQCVWAGDATVRIWTQRGNGPRQPRELQLSTGTAREAPDPGLRLLRLEPVPVAGQALPPRDYVATFAFAASAPER